MLVWVLEIAEESIEDWGGVGREKKSFHPD